MGGQAWSNPHPLNNFVPTTVTNNVFRGNIGFSIVINRWVDGLMKIDPRLPFILVGIDTMGGVWTAKWASSRYSTACGSGRAACEADFEDRPSFDPKITPQPSIAEVSPLVPRFAFCFLPLLVRHALQSPGEFGYPASRREEAQGRKAFGRRNAKSGDPSHDASDALDTRMAPTDQEARHLTTTPSGNNKSIPHFPAISHQDFSKAPGEVPSPGGRSCSSLATTVVSSPAPSPRRRQHFQVSRPGARTSEPDTMPFLVAVAKLAAFTDVFLTGLIIPLLPTILESRAHVPQHQAQIWTSVLVAAHGGAVAVVSPFMPLLTRRGPSGYAVLLAGLAGAAAAFALLQLSHDLGLLIFARALQGLSAAAITGASSAILASATSSRPSSCGLASLTPAFLQSVAMTTAPALAGTLHDYYDADAVFYCAYTCIALSGVLGLVAVTATPASHLRASNEPEPRSRSEIPAERSGQQDPATAVVGAVALSPGLLVGLYGYLVLALLTSALQGVLPLFVERRFNWSVLATGYTFVPLSAPAALIGPLAGALAVRVPKSTRFLTTVGFLACLPAFLHLGQLGKNTKLRQHPFFLTLGGLSLATGLCGDPLAKEITSVLASSANDSWSATALATSLPSLAHAWGSLVGPLLAGAVSWLWGWQTMNTTLAAISAATGVASLLFLQGWIGSPSPEIRAHRTEARSDEESAPLLTNDRSSRSLYGPKEEYGGGNGDDCKQRQDSDGVSPHSRTGADRKSRTHRRHFSVDNFSVATTTTPGSIDSSASSVRFQAALETPTLGASTGGVKRPSTDSATGKSAAERRFVMREAPHAPATDPLLAAGSLYVIDEERDTGRGVESRRHKRRVVVFAEGSAPPELLARHRHHVVAINALDGTAQMVADSTEDHAVHVTEEAAGDETAFSDATARRYVVVVVEGEDDAER
ncbi:446239ec-858d-443f-831f-ec1cc5195287 [Thermothielavioides terrestris]|uniref:446239ec-858d-443f-831f-ec1cc5195287 n=1 Tax=Thermothielavioides terrestris TaxID=2587410 RepID=A0A3S4BG69_9PEZI|nr:446239ec-858d-443f-831f-ec1cc5195287 [Thermothielavioides terrestris]